MSTYLPDEVLAYWGDRFVSSAIRHQLTFERFLGMSPARRNQAINLQDQIEESTRQADRLLPTSSALHGSALIAPIKPNPKRRRRPWFFRLR